MSTTATPPAPGSQVRLLKDVQIAGTGSTMKKGTVATVVRSPNKHMASFCWVHGPATGRNTATIRLLPEEWEEIAAPSC